MPSAPSALTGLFEDDSAAVEIVCRRHFIDALCFIRPKGSKDNIPKPTTEDEAIAYLILEWDYGYRED